MAITVGIDSVVAGFRINSLLGKGAMGAVYLAEDRASGDRVALKVLAPELAQDERFRQRFLRESQLAERLASPHVVRTISSGEENGLLYLVMDYIEGSDLRQLLQDERRLEPERAVALVGQVAEALDVAHAAGLVHRDVKPGNILIGQDSGIDHAYVCDFGLARHLSSVSSLTGERAFVGTIDYVPPEQIEGGTIDGRADVYSLGCVLYECLTGERPFARDSDLSTVFAHLNEPPPAITDVRPELPQAFDGVFATALAKVPDDRYATCGELARAARAALQGRVIARRKRRGRLLATAAVVVVAAGASITIITTRHGSSPSPPAITQTSIAGAKIGLTKAAYSKILGGGIPVTQQEGSEKIPATGFPTLTFNDKKVWVFFGDKNGGTKTATIIATWNKDFKTDRGIGPCSTVADLKKAYGDKVRPDHFGNAPDGQFMYDVGKNLLFAATNPKQAPGPPATYVTEVGLYNGSTPHADENFGAHPFAGFVTGNETPQCVP